MKSNHNLLIAGSFSILIAFSSSAQGTIPTANQGEINFFTYNANPAKGEVFYAGFPLGGTWIGQLYYSDVSSVATMSPLSAPTAFSGGYINFGMVKDPSDEAGKTIWYELVVWNSSSGNTFQSAMSNSSLIAYGTSSVAQVVLGGLDLAGDTPIIPSQANGFDSFTLAAAAVPEPATSLIAVCGVVCLFFFRRQQK